MDLNKIFKEMEQEALSKHPQEDWPIDPSRQLPHKGEDPQAWLKRVTCNAHREGFNCNKPKDHKGEHIAWGSGGFKVATWPMEQMLVSEALSAGR